VTGDVAHEAMGTICCIALSIASGEFSQALDEDLRSRHICGFGRLADDADRGAGGDAISVSV